MHGKAEAFAGIACCLSGLFLVVAFQPVGWSCFGWVALAPAWVALQHSNSVHERPLRYGYLVGLIFTIGSFWWIAAVSLPGFVIMAAVLSFYPALWFLLVARLLPGREAARPLRSLTDFGRAGLAAAFWVTLEWLRSWFLTGFNWNELGVSQTPHACLRQLAALGGVPLLSFVLALVGILLGETIRPLRSTAALMALGALLIFSSVWLYGWNHLDPHRGEAPGHVLSYATIQPNIPEIPYRSATPLEVAPRESSAFHLQEQLSALAIQTRQPDLLIWPEAVTAQRMGIDPLLGQVIGNVMRHVHGDFLLGAEELEAGKLYTGAYLFRHAAALQKYRKTRLVVLSEYPPLREALPGAFDYGFTPGLGPASLALTHQPLRLSPLICFEETQPEAVDAAARLHPDFFVVLTNDDWFPGLPAQWILRQQLQNGLLRTVEHDRPMIRCANTGISCEISPDGSVLDQVESTSGKVVEVRGILARSLSLYAPRRTPFELFGNWVLHGCQLVTLLTGGLYLRRHARQRRSARS